MGCEGGGPRGGWEEGDQGGTGGRGEQGGGGGVKRVKRGRVEDVEEGVVVQRVKRVGGASDSRCK